MIQHKNIKLQRESKVGYKDGEGSGGRDGLRVAEVPWFVQPGAEEAEQRPPGPTAPHGHTAPHGPTALHGHTAPHGHTVPHGGLQIFTGG